MLFEHEPQTSVSSVFFSFFTFKLQGVFNYNLISFQTIPTCISKLLLQLNYGFSLFICCSLLPVQSTLSHLPVSLC